MYHKDLDKEKILTAAIDLMQQEGPAAVSFRSLARSIGCAHTNIYNFFKDSESLLRACGPLILNKLGNQLVAESSHSKVKAARLKYLYATHVRFYLDHPGWFQLIWSYPIQLKHSNESASTLKSLIGNTVQLFAENLENCRTPAQAHHLLHVVHAYLLGEVSIYFAGRSLFASRQDLEQNVIEHCLLLTNLLDTEETARMSHFIK